MDSKTSKFVVVGFNTEAYEPNEIATVSAAYPTFDAAYDALKQFAEEDGCFEPRDFNPEQGTVIDFGCHRGYYVQEIFIA